MTNQSITWSIDGSNNETIKQSTNQSITSINQSINQWNNHSQNQSSKPNQIKTIQIKSIKRSINQGVNKTIHKSTRQRHKSNNRLSKTLEWFKKLTCKANGPIGHNWTNLICLSDSLSEGQCNKWNVQHCATCVHAPPMFLLNHISIPSPIKTIHLDLIVGCYVCFKEGGPKLPPNLTGHVVLYGTCVFDEWIKREQDHGI